MPIFLQIFVSNHIYITLHYRHFKRHLHLKWPMVHQQCILKQWLKWDFFTVGTLSRQRSSAFRQHPHGVGHREVSRTPSLLRKFWILLVRFYVFGVYILVENGVPTCDMIINWTRRQLVIRNFNFLLNKINILIWYLYNQFCDYLS